MNKYNKVKALAQTVFAAVAVTGLVAGLASIHCLAEPPVDAPSKTDSVTGSTNSTSATAQPPEAAVKNVAAKAPLTGAELYSVHCNRCHQERYPTERTGASWKTIMLHMQVRANIPVSQSKLILQYLQENSGR